MDRNQAIQLLASFRPGHDDPASHPWTEAFGVLDRDPVLANWFRRQQTLDEAIGFELRNVSPPVGLKQAILDNRPSRRVPFWRRPVLSLSLAAAAVASIVAAGILLQTSRASTFASYHAAMIEYVAHDYEIGVHAGTIADLKQSLAQLGWPSDFTVPSSFHQLHVEGGCARWWNRHRVTLVCMETDDHKDVWLYVVPRSALNDANAGATPTIVEPGQLPSAYWVAGDYLYLMVVEGDMSMLKQALDRSD